ncbi:MAG: OmpA family protein [Desulfococcaceae bacterium]|jgi:OOP family OmpA-OmpF porin|nr:OmpA family protein [Desulfococcaceae bacterium]
MERSWLNFLFFLLLMFVLTACASQQTQNEFDAGASGSPEAGAVPGGADSGGVSDVAASYPESADGFVVDPDKLEFGKYMEEHVDNFLVILDASGSKFLPYRQQIKLKVAKDITRRFNKKTPERPLFGGLRRYGWEAGAFTTRTSLLYGMTAYDREDYADAIEVVRWAGGKSPLALAIDRASDDFQAAPDGPTDYLALVIVSDGKILKEDPDPVLAARRIKERYGDRICIYTVAVGDDFPFDKANVPKEKWRYHEKYKLLRDVAKEGKCGYMVTADDLIPDENMETFADDVFTRRKRLLDRLPCPDADGDGVCDDVDKCPGTPKGAKVDKDGCWILGRVQFDLNKWNIKDEYKAMLNDIAYVLRLNPDVKLAVQGHTCTIWTEDYNMKLSHWRAMAVMSYLINQGAKPEQLAVEGYGFHRPFASNETDEGRILNRRAEFKRLQ